MKWVTIKKAAELSGYSPTAIEHKRESGLWAEGDIWFRAPDGQILLSVERIKSWTDGGASIPQQRPKLTETRSNQSLNLAQAAKFLNIHPHTCARMTRAGRIPGCKIGRAYVYHQDILDDYLRDQCQKTSKYSNPQTPASSTSAITSAEKHLQSRLALLALRTRRNSTGARNSESGLPSRSEGSEPK
jgi:excisionase family DNA binding protein